MVVNDRKSAKSDTYTFYLIKILRALQAYNFNIINNLFS